MLLGGGGGSDVTDCVWRGRGRQTSVNMSSKLPLRGLPRINCYYYLLLLSQESRSGQAVRR